MTGQMSRILVTGGAGFIGSHVADALIRRGHEVTVLDDLSGGYRDNVPPAAAFVHGSIVDADAGRPPLPRNSASTHVYHLAAYAAEGLSHFIKRFNYTNNVVGSVNLLNAAVNTGVQTFVFTSSIAVYGSSPELPMTEETPAHPEDSYGIAKQAVELELRACRDIFELDFIIFRPHNVYGPHQNIARSVPQRDRHLHEPDPARPADDDFRRRHTDARLQLHRRRRAADGRGH